MTSIGLCGVCAVLNADGTAAGGCHEGKQTNFGTIRRKQLQMKASNNIKAREALEEVLSVLKTWYCPDPATAAKVVALTQKCEAALSSPPRNCDRPECRNYITATKMFEREVPSSTWMFGSDFFCELGKWILSPYKKRK